MNKKYLTPILPYIAVWIGLYFFKNAWLALIGFHAAILLSLAVVKSKPPIAILLKSKYPKWVLVNILFCGASGIGFYLLWNFFGIVPDLSAQLDSMGLNSTGSWVAFISYFSLVNPLIEEYFWRGVLENNSKQFCIGDFVYAGYHAVVLWGKAPLLIVIFAVVALASVGWFWRQSAREDGGLLSAVLGHMVADFSILSVVCWMCVTQ